MGFRKRKYDFEVDLFEVPMPRLFRRDRGGEIRLLGRAVLAGVFERD